MNNNGRIAVYIAGWGLSILALIILILSYFIIDIRELLFNYDDTSPIINVVYVVLFLIICLFEFLVFKLGKNKSFLLASLIITTVFFPVFESQETYSWGKENCVEQFREKRNCFGITVYSKQTFMLDGIVSMFFDYKYGSYESGRRVIFSLNPFKEIFTSNATFIQIWTIIIGLCFQYFKSKYYKKLP
jgi:hypothetical protein